MEGCEAGLLAEDGCRAKDRDQKLQGHALRSVFSKWFDEAWPRHVAKIMENHDTHGWQIAALLREMSGLEGKAMFECVESSFFNR